MGILSLRWLLRTLLFGLLTVGLVACSGQRVLNTLSSSGSFVRASHLVYDPATGTRLDVYAPPEAQHAPVVVFFYGGRWSSGSKNDYVFVGEALASLGFVAVIADCRQYPEVRFPVFLEDAAKAVSWTLSNVGAYGGSPQRVFLLGHSSGAHVAAMLALDPRYLEAEKLRPSLLRGMIGLAGPYDFLPIRDPTLRAIFGPPERFPDSQPVRFQGQGAPPMMLMHGKDDEVVSVSNTESLAASVSRSGGFAETVIYPELSHTRIIGALGPVLRSRYDVLSNIDSFVREWKDKDLSSLYQTPGLETQPLDSEPAIQTQPLPGT